jgi:hypothetical protein
MCVCLLWMLAGFAAAAQNPSDLFAKAPPAVDQALRQRVTPFFQAHVDGRFRQAEQYVAEESKDAFYEAEKRRCRSFEIVRINYEENFSKAGVVINCETEVLIPPKGLVAVRMPLASRWKVVDRDWYWYVESRPTVDSPFGKMTASPRSQGQGTPLPTGPSPADLAKMVTLDRNTLFFPPLSAGEAEIVVSNSMEGQVRVEIAPLSATDVKAEMDKTVIGGRGEGKLRVRYQPDASKPRQPGSSEEIRLTVQPISREYVVMVKFLQ